MTSPSTGYACPRCRTALDQGANFCRNCGADISGVWGPGGEAYGKTIAVEVDSKVDTLGQLLSTATLGEYDIYGELGRGGMAAVYLGLDLSLNRKVAIKTMLPELVSKEGMVQRFKREAQTSAALSHPHIIQIYTVKETKQLVYFVMKFIEGRSLESVINEKGPVSLEMAQVILSQVAGALEYAHKKNVIHRDIKPANIMIDEDGWAIVTDFGIAKVTADAQNLTATGTAIGTPHYMSPEQFHNKAVTGASDQYSLGIVAYEMLLGKKPFDGATYAEIITQHLFEPVPDLRAQRPEIPEHIAKVVHRMLAKDPAERYPNLEAAVTELGTPHKKEGDVVRTQMISLVKNGPQKKVRMSVPMSPIPVTKKPSSPAARTVIERREPPKRRTGMIAAAAAAVLLGGGYFGWNAIQSDPAPPASVVAPSVTPAGTQAGADSTPVATAQPETRTPDSTVSAPAVTPARVTVSNVPNGATITMNGRRQAGRTFEARPGTYELRVEASGFEPMSRRITVEPGERFEIAFDRRARATAPPVATRPVQTKTEAPSTQGLATLRLILTPPSSVIFDGVDKGQQSRIALEELLPGTHTLRVQRDGWMPKDTVVTLSAGQIATIRIQLTERP
jgi:serine/threonine protein kinase